MATPSKRDDKTPGVDTPPNDATRQLSESGTPRYRDETQPDEYVRDLAEPVKRMEIFDEMRSSDEGINTAIAAREQLIGSANWMMACADDKPTSREILDFCEDNIYPVLPELLRHLSGAVQYGFGTVETVFEWSDKPFARNVARGKVRRATKTMGRRIYLKRLAHIRQRTINTFVVPTSGELTALRQYVYAGGSFSKADIPIDKVLLWTYNRRGDDYWGQPPTRHAYKAWKFKMQIEKLNLLGLDRFGVGTPVAEEGEGWTDTERNRLDAFLASWRSGQNTFLRHPMGGKINIVSGDGRMVMSALEWVRYYALGIAKTFLTQGTELGSTETGARALGETFYDQMEGVTQSDCEDIANLINERLIVPLVDWNFGPQESYPIFSPSQRVRMSPAIATVVRDLITVKAVKWDPKDEQWLRDALGLHEIDIKAREVEDAADKVAADKLAAQPALNPGNQQNPTNTENVPAKEQLRALSSVIPQIPSAAAAQADPYRVPAYTEWEARILRPEIVGRDLDLAAIRLTGEVTDVLREIDAELYEKARALALRGAQAVAENIRTIAVSGKLRARLRAALTIAAARTRTYGSNTVHSEIARQETLDGAAPARAPHTGLRAFVSDVKAIVLATDPTPEERGRDLRIAAEIDRAVEDEVDRREASVRSSLLTGLQLAGSLSVARFSQVVAAAVRQALESLSPGRTTDNVGGVINVAFGVGRNEAASEILAGGAGGSGGDDGSVVGHIAGPIAKVYSAVMDGGTCEECSKWDGAQFPLDYPEDVTGVQAPNPRCHGSYKRCRCVWILVLDREVQSMVPPAKGVENFRRAA